MAEVYKSKHIPNITTLTWFNYVHNVSVGMPDSVLGHSNSANIYKELIKHRNMTQ